MRREPALGTLSAPRRSLMTAPTLESLLLQALDDDRTLRRLIGRLRLAVTGWHYPRRRLARMPWRGKLQPGRVAVG